MPYATRAVTCDALLEMMKPGALYAAHVLARKFNVPSAQVNSILLELVTLGKLVSVKATRPPKNRCFMLAGTEHLRHQPPPKPQIDPATVAQPRTYTVLTGEIRGYDAEIARRWELCMSIRRVA